MSSFKKATKLNQKVHRERDQPEARKHLGLLEKHKDYVKRARHENKNKETLKLLHKKALNKNPDEFYHHMINANVKEGVHFEKTPHSIDTPEQTQLMRTQDLKYLTFKRTQEFKKIERLQSELHLTTVDNPFKNTHIRFGKQEKSAESDFLKALSEKELPDVDIEALREASNERKRKYLQLAKRLNREKQLSIVQSKLHIKKCLDDKNTLMKPKRIKKGSKTSAPVYQWKYERKK